jgi:hypothetical protein
MRLGLGLLLAVALAAAPAKSFAMPVVGLGEQQHGVFADQRVHDLGVRHVRYVVAWDALSSDWQRGEIDAYLGEAQRTGTEVLVAFNESRTRRDKYAPSRKQYTRQFRRFRRAYPWVTTFIPWNEANHCSQPTCNRPDLAAMYFDIMRSECTRCTVLAADLLDYGDMAGWIREFKRHVRHKTRIWGLHNYVDANRFRTSGTRRMLKAVNGKIWFTETGGLVYRHNSTKIPMNESPAHAAKAVRWVLTRLAEMSTRVERIYFYHWMPAAGNRKERWDSALTDHKGRPRPALKVLQEWVRARDAAQARQQASG